ncbi:hypothetical protein G5C51_05350 [Streptomyces sp. A7024]|uniref:Uncharacterized protein n=1 Tax=Streptomyces coryli TaxID=1128680 RepID=A0A6G4TU49_9ACTN|nr:hypothetical protein [Streptomyces coryli]NGN63333.1 hypothetical protein [Streptomyces coryli]
MTARRFEAGCGIGCLLVLCGALAGVGSWLLARSARRACHVYVSEWPDMLSWRFWELPLSIGAGAVAATAVYALAGARGRTGAAVVATLVVLVALTWVQFAWLGTPAGAGTAEAPTCPASNIPPWWPDWLPA